MTHYSYAYTSYKHKQLCKGLLYVVAYKIYVFYL